jgi:hypothetical protein
MIPSLPSRKAISCGVGVDFATGVQSRSGLLGDSGDFVGIVVYFSEATIHLGV